ncbi:MAG: gliding motility protein GldL [Bacteroidia bacterium]|nr:gliding motility protein GldL [Bacteroidia bacterium]
MFYGLGAAVAILGTLFKLLHLDGANFMLSLGLGTEVFIFTISALEPPYRNYHWEYVFPILKTHADGDRPDFQNLPGGQTTEGMATEVYVGDTTIPGEGKAATTNFQGGAQAGGTVYVGGGVPSGGGVPYTPHRNSMAGVTPEQARENYGIPPQVPISDEDAATLTDSIKKMGEAVSQLNNLADITMVTENYISKLSGMADNLNRFSDATGSLAEVSNVLLDSYRNVTENSDEISANSKGYVEQMGNLNRNLSGLNTIYEIQLKSVSSQIDTIDRVNKGLVHIREMYESSTGDSDRFSKETEAMADNLARLNMVYARMLEAMSPNAIFANMMAGSMNAGRTPEAPAKSEETDGKES